MKKKFTAIKLLFHSPLHIGTGKETYDTASGYLHSDMISSALCAIRCQLIGTEGFNDFRESYRISSAFPYIGEYLFLPKPVGKMNIHIQNEPEEAYRKELKKIEFIEKSLWERLICGEELIIRKEQIVQSKYLIPAEITLDKFSGIISEVQQRVRIGSFADIDPEPYYFERMYFGSGTGLYCLLDASSGQSNEIIKLFEALGENGIGTDRSVGNGFFTIEVKETELTTADNANYCINLSLTVPEREEIDSIDLENSYYQLLSRSGYIAGSSHDKFKHLRKKSIYSFAEGSVFKSQSLNGKWVDMRPDWNDSTLHAVWRDFRGFCLPVNLKL